MRTIHGYPLNEVTSALQKAIRRSKSDEALWWAMEMNMSGLGAYCFRRLMVIANEDIGPADSFAAVLVWSCYSAAKELHAHSRGTGDEKARAPWDTETLLHPVWYMANCPKSREVNHAASVIQYRMEKGERLEVPDYALDNHTDRGRAQGRRQGFFQQVGQVLDPEAEVKDQMGRVNPWKKAWDAERPLYRDEGGDRIED
ncbi:MAG: hypothetical protein ACOYB2_11015 [Limnohabitans sp.]